MQLITRLSNPARLNPETLKYLYIEKRERVGVGLFSAVYILATSDCQVNIYNNKNWCRYTILYQTKFILIA